MKQHRKLILILAVVLSVAIAAGSTMAYLQDTDEDVNVMTLGNVYIDQLEYERVDTETVGDAAVVQPFEDDKPLYPAVYDEYSVWQPGETENDAIITWDQLGNEGSWNGIWDPAELNNEVDKFVFVKNTGTAPAYVRTWFAFELGNLTMQEWWDLTHLNVNSSHWSGLEKLENYSEETIGGVRYAVACATYTRNDGILQPGELSRPSLLQVALDKEADNKTIEGFGETYEILVVSQAIQTAGFDTAVAALEEGFGENHPFKDNMVDEELAEKEHNATHPVEYNGVRYATLKEGVDMAQANGGGVVKVHAPLKEAATVVIPANLSVTIEGKGDIVSRADGFTGNLISVCDGAKLTLKNITLDGGAVWTGDMDDTLQRGTVNSGVTATGNLIAMGNNGALILDAGTVLQNNVGSHAVNLGTRQGNTLTLNGAQIINNSSDSGAIWGGGHITINEGSQINYNSSTGNAGAIRMVGKCNLTMNGGEISNNKAAGDGGAIWGYGINGNTSTYEFNGGEIANNESAGTGGAIYTGNYSELKIYDGFELHDNKAANSGAIRLTDHTSMTMTGGRVYGNTQNGVSNAFNTWNNSISITGGSIEDDFSYVGGLGLTIGKADIDGVISYNLSTNHNTAYLAEEFNGFSFKVNEGDTNFSNFNFKPAAGYSYTEGDENKFVCLNEGYSVYWDANTSTFRLQAE